MELILEDYRWEVSFEVEDRGAEQDCIPYVMQLEIANVPVKEWIIDPHVHGLLDGTCSVVHLPTHYGKVVHTDVMTRDVAMVIHERQGPKVFHKPFPKGPCRFIYVLFITFQFVTLIPVDYSVFLCYVVPVP